jgi:class 3 adenylate cyclase
LGLRESAGDSINEPAFALVYCLVLDMIGGTKFGLGLSQDKYRKWTVALPKQLSRHWDALNLSDAMLKFEGDGWLILTPETRLVSELCCLGLVMVRCFQGDMARMTGLDLESIPPLRAAITAGMDLNLLLPNSHRDWAGDSARRAVRASGYCDGSTVLVSETVKQMVVRDFELHPFDRDTAKSLSR